MAETAPENTAAIDTEAALRHSEYRYRNLFQAMAASFWELDFAVVGGMVRDLRKAGIADLRQYFADHPAFVREMMRQTHVLDVNDQTVVLLGRGNKQEMLQSVEPFWPEASNSIFAESVVAAVSRKLNYSAETKLRTIEGREFDALFTACFPPESMAKGTLLIGVIDISERVRAQQALQRIQADFTHAARVSMLGELTASIAHEVNQPLAAITTNGEAGLRWLNRPEPDLAEAIALTRSMATRSTPDHAALSLNGVIEEAMLFLRHEMQAQGVMLKLDLAGDLPAVMGDRTQLQQVVVNLALNAMQAMAQAKTMDRTIVISSGGVADRLQVAIADTGPGIPPDVQERLFDSFFTTKESGMGMGLPICRSIIEAHGGEMRSESNAAAGGAVFRFTLPAAAAL
jgi:signal transduction histidine kinase